MKVQLTNDLGVKGVGVTRQWTVVVLNDDGAVAFQESSITSTGALHSLRQRVQKVLEAVDEMLPEASSTR
jgi:hypothetical protein